MIGIALLLPSGDFLDKGLFVGNAAVMPAAVFGSVVPFEALEQPSGFGRRESLVE